MSIKLIARIGLPYILRLNTDEKLENELPKDPNYSYFKISFLPNVEDNPNFSSNFSANTCNTIELEVIINNYSTSNYKLIKNSIYNIYDVSEEDQTEIFEGIVNKLNRFLIFLNKVTKMFWIREISVNPIGGAIGTRTDFVFTDPNVKVRDSARDWYTINDNFMVDLYSDNIKPINGDILEKFKDTYVVNSIWITYMEKANRAMYVSEYEEFIIYCAIAAESFIKQLVSTFPDQNDVVLMKLKEVGRNNNIVETYYVTIMDYLCGTNLRKADEKLYKNLKDIFILRNEIMHTGSLNKNSYKRVGIENLDFIQVNLYAKRLDLAINKCSEIFAKTTHKSKEFNKDK
ncbi:hypothetical protein [Bacillus haynesii]|uniref:hypothetical protein n=1 Tax=Bacillus haynesii TaxID=1925021 RepID=UPI002282C3A4|nr:hypothetical protein [Bacillus haynesii]MCY8378391.1 hypothetical protein [Bacillus haynesii]MCY8611748.1 hypothetical protein [Bacillus haynesii]MEC0676646.1 hypothetical protein [Bacillus haynesii]